MSAETLCDWCGREAMDAVIDDNGDRFDYCHRHEDQVKSLIFDPEEDRV